MHVARAVAAQRGVAATVLIDPPPESGDVLLRSAVGAACLVLGTRASPAASALAEAARRAWPTASSEVEVHAVPTDEPGFADPRWPLNYGPEETQAAHARLLAFLERHMR